MTMSAEDLFQRLRDRLEDEVGDRHGTFKVPSVDEAVSVARQAASSRLGDDERTVLAGAIESFRAWLIERDPEATRRVALGGHPPQDIDLMVKVAEDLGAGWLVGLDDVALGALDQRMSACQVLSDDELRAAARRPMRLTDGGVRLMLLGVVVMVLGSLINFLAALAGAVIVLTGLRRWRIPRTRSKIAPSHVMRGGTMGRRSS
jgi:hypothetical protein